MLYRYDFGDNWEHDVTVEREVDGDGVPRCVAGARACPPEDVGGLPGYEHFLAAIGDARHPDHDDMVALIGGEFDPEAFDPARVELSAPGKNALPRMTLRMPPPADAASLQAAAERA